MKIKQGLPEYRFLTVPETAKLMRVSRMTVYRLVQRGDLPSVRIGKSYRLPEAAVRAFLHAYETATLPRRP